MYGALLSKQSGVPFSHSLMIPWMAEFVVGTIDEGKAAEKVLGVARDGSSMSKVYYIQLATRRQSHDAALAC